MSKYIKELLNQWVILVTGTILAVALTFFLSFGTQIVSHSDAYIIDLTIVLVALIVATYKSWKSIYIQNSELTTKLEKLEHQVPVYALSIIDRDSAYSKLLSEIDDKIYEAQAKEAATKPSGIWNLPTSALLGGPPTKDDWQKYIKELKKLGNDIKSFRQNHLLLNILVANIGSISDSSIKVTLRFNKLELEPTFYRDEIAYKRPIEPDRNFTYSLGVPKISRQGINREALSASQNSYIFEINRMHVGEDITASSYPLAFKKPVDPNASIKYEITSAKITKPLKGTIKLVR